MIGWVDSHGKIQRTPLLHLRLDGAVVHEVVLTRGKVIPCPLFDMVLFVGYPRVCIQKNAKKH